MARDHRIFAIARFGNHYHTVVVVHHSNLCDGFSPAVCLRLIDVFSDESKRRLLELELGLAADLCRDQGPPTSPKPRRLRHAGPVRFPFITLCLVISPGASLGARLPPINAGNDNNLCIPADGVDEGRTDTCISVLDITELDEVRYGFTSLFHLSQFSNGDSADIFTLGANTPWPGSYFVGQYHTTGDYERAELAEELARHPLVHMPALKGRL